MLVRSGGPVFRSNEAFASYQLAPRHPRTAVGQLADGRILLVVTDGRRPGYSVGMTNFELAQTIARLGAVTGSAFDAGGSSTLAFDGQLLNRPSDRGGERPVSTALQLMYYGVYAPAAEPVISPNGDGFAEAQRELSYKVVRPVERHRDSRRARRRRRLHGDRCCASPGRTPSLSRRRRSTHCRADAAGRGPLAARRHRHRRPRARLDDDPDLRVNNTLGFAKLSRRSLVVRDAWQADDLGRSDADARRARLTATVETTSGVQVATIAIRRLPAGRFVASWRGTTRGGKFLVYGGMYVVRFRATNELGAVELVSAGVPCHPRGAAAGQEAKTEGLESTGAGRVDPVRRSRTSSRPSVGDYGLYAVFLLMLIDAVLPAASEAVMVYGGAVAAGAFAGQDVQLFGWTLDPGFEAYLAIALAGTIGYTSARSSAGGSACAAGGPFLERHGRWLHLNEAKLDARRALVRPLGGLGRLPRPDHARSSAPSSRSRPASSKCRSGATSL